MSKDIRVSVSKSSDELMVHYPNGRVEFVGFLDFIRIAWWAARNRVEVTVADETDPPAPKEPTP